MNSRESLALTLAAVGVAVTTTMTATSAIAAAPGGASSGATTSGAIAKYGDQSIRLSEGWGAAKSCVVYSGGSVECFKSNAAADLNLIRRGLAAADSFGLDAKALGNGEAAVSYIPDCADRWLCLWEHTSGGGRRLIFQDEAWQYLAKYGFENQVSSYRNRQWDGAGILHDDEGWADYKLESKGYASSIGGFNDRADSVHP